ncbi:MAG: Uma2 family endonuclease [Candidatus Latescibacterota bacterium]
MQQTRVKLGLKDQGRPVRLEEFCAAEFEEPYRYERMGGRLVVMSPSGLRHNRIVSETMEALFAYKAGRRGVIELIVPEAWLGPGEEHDRIADIGVYLVADAPQSEVQRERVAGVVFEVVSEGSEERDYVIKRKEYFDAGVREYVIVDPLRRAVTVLVRGESGFVDRELGEGDVYRSGQLPGFELRVSDLPF